jgi:outer membrane receptor protein involved in Fe transport
VFLQAEWVRLGAYWLEASNSPGFGRYPGHDLLNLRASWQATPQFNLFARILNAGDRRYADSASVSSNTPVFTPGLPRSAYGGVDYRW